MNILTLILLVILGLIAISFAFDFNIGAPAVLAALLIGKGMLHYSTGRIMGYVPAGTILSMVSISVFYGYAMENGTTDVLIHALLNRYGKRLPLLPVVMFFLTCGLAGAGLGSGNATMIMAPIALSLASEIGIQPLVMALAVGAGAAAGSNFPFSYGGVIATSLIDAAGCYSRGTEAILSAALKNMLIQSLSFLLLYVFLKGYRIRGSKTWTVEKLTPLQKKNARLIAVVVLFSIVPTLLKVFLPCNATNTLASFLDINTVMLCGIVAANILKLADVRTVTRQHVPWLLIVVISGISMLIGIARENGIVEALSGIISSNFPSWAVPYLVLVTSMVMSLFGGAISIVIPSLYPLIPGLASVSGLDMGLLYGAVLTGATCGGLSPFSSGGMILQSAYPDEKKRRPFMLGLLCLPLYQITVALLVYTLF